jgi:hypothetical protein
VSESLPVKVTIDGPASATPTTLVNIFKSTVNRCAPVYSIVM